MPKRRVMRSSSAGGISVLDQCMFKDPSAAWDEKATPPSISIRPPEVVYPTLYCEHKPKNMKLAQALKPKSARKAAAPGRKPLPDLKTSNQLKPVAQRSDQGQKVIFTLGSPCQELGNFETVANLKVGEFFQACFLCKKKIGKKDGVFMYGILQAFCSPNCRDKKIKFDEDVEKAFNKLST